MDAKSNARDADSADEKKLAEPTNQELLGDGMLLSYIDGQVSGFVNI